MLARALIFSGSIGIALSLASCADTTSISPVVDRVSEPEFVSRDLRRTAAVQLRLKATLLEDGSVRLRLRGLCPPGFQVVEGPVSVMQGPEFQEIFGEGFFTVACTGHWQWKTVRVIAPEGFQRGTAKVTASLMVEHPTTGAFLQGDDRGVLIIR
jgi:hypothetical protein